MRRSCGLGFLLVSAARRCGVKSARGCRSFSSLKGTRATQVLSAYSPQRYYSRKIVRSRPVGHYYNSMRNTRMYCVTADEVSYVIDVDESSFQQLVVDASETKGILLDCHASWCGPCKQIAPLLEEEVAKKKGQVQMCKLDIDQNKELAQKLNIQSIPLVLAIYKSQVVDTILGLSSRERITECLDKLIAAANSTADVVDAEKEDPKDSIISLFEAGDLALDKGEHDEARSNFQIAADFHDARYHAQALAGLILCEVAAKNIDKAKELAKEIELNHPTKLSKIEVQRAFSALELAVKASQDPNATKEQNAAIESLRATVSKNPTDLQSQYDLANALFVAGDHAAAMEEALKLLKKDKHWNKEAARKFLLQMFDTLGKSNPHVVKYRPRFAGIWFT